MAALWQPYGNMQVYVYIGMGNMDYIAVGSNPTIFKYKLKFKEQ